MKSFAEYQEEFIQLCRNGMNATGEEIRQWAYSRKDVTHFQLALCAEQVVNKYFMSDRPLGRKTYYKLQIWANKNGFFYDDLEYDDDDGEYVSIRRDLEKSPRMPRQ